MSFCNDFTPFFTVDYIIQKSFKMKHRIKQYVDQYHDMLCIELDSESESHLFRHASEITKETKGGYLKGQIIIPSSSKPCYLRLSLVPSEPDLQNNPFHLHPNLLHLNLRQNKKSRNLKVSNFRYFCNLQYIHTSLNFQKVPLLLTFFRKIWQIFLHCNNVF